MKTLFYLIGILPVLWEFMCFDSPKRTFNFVSRTTKDLKEGGKKLSSSQTSLILLNVGYFLWNIIGFFTSQWICFAAIFLLGFIPKKKLWIHFLDGLITFLILIFIILNEYHFHINVIQFLKQ